MSIIFPNFLCTLLALCLNSSTLSCIVCNTITRQRDFVANMKGIVSTDQEGWAYWIN